MKPNNPLVSIVIPSYNRASLIRETLDSVCSQVYPHWECIVVDDGSTDDTCAIVEEYAAKDRRFKLLLRDRSPKGACTCRNIGLAHAEGEWVIFFDSDDVMSPALVDRRIDFASANQGYDWYVFHGAMLSDHRLICTLASQGSYIDDFLCKRVNWFPQGVLWRRDFISELKWNEDIFSIQDQDLHIRALMRSDNYLICDDFPDWYYRICASDMFRISNNTTSFSYVLNRVKTYTYMQACMPQEVAKRFKRYRKREFMILVDGMVTSFAYQRERFEEFSEVVLDYYGRKASVYLMLTYSFFMMKMTQYRVPVVRGLVIRCMRALKLR